VKRSQVLCVATVLLAFVVTAYSQQLPAPPTTAPAEGRPATQPQAKFFEAGLQAASVVLIIDHSGSMLDNFSFVTSEATSAVKALSPTQYFAVVMVSDRVTTIGPETLQRATPDAKAAFFDAIRNERAEGQNDDLLAPFQKAFELAFRMKPATIVFLTDGRFGGALPTVIKGLNEGKRVRIDTIALASEDPEYRDRLAEIAKDNGGEFRFVPEHDLGKPAETKPDVVIIRDPNARRGAPAKP